MSSEIRERWARWLDAIYDDVLTLRLYQANWVEMREVLEANPSIPQPNHVADWIYDLYGIVMAVGVRRQGDRGEDVATLGRLIDDVARHPEAMPRGFFVGRYPDFLREHGTADADFDGFAQPGAACIDPDIIRRDLADLGNAVAVVKPFVNQHLAHLGENREGVTATYEDVELALLALDRLLRRYYLLVDGGGLVSTIPAKQYDFTRPLIVPWAPNDRLLRLLREKGRVRTDDAESRVRDLLRGHADSISVELAEGLLAKIDELRAELAGV